MSGINNLKPKVFLDITNLKTSAMLLALIQEIVELSARVNALESIAMTTHNSRVIEAALEHTKKEPWYMNMQTELQICFETIKVAKDNPQMVLQHMIREKFDGKL